MRFLTIGRWAVGVLPAAVSAGLAAEPVAFEKHMLTDQYCCDGINAGDINRDGRPDIVAGPFWYENPRGEEGLWRKYFVFERIRGETPPFADLNLVAVDVTGDAAPDILTASKLGTGEHPVRQPAQQLGDPIGREVIMSTSDFGERRA